MNLSNPYVVSVVAGLIACVLLYLNHKMTDSDTPLTTVDYSKVFVIGGLLVFISLYLGCGTQSTGGKLKGGKITHEAFNTGNPGF